MNPLRNLDPSKGQRYFVESVPHSVALGLEFGASGVGWVRLELPWREDLVGDPETGVVHGGVITTLVDAGCGSAVLTCLEELQRIVTLDLRIDYLRPAGRGRSPTRSCRCRRRGLPPPVRVRARERARAVVTTAVYMAFADGLIGEVLTQMLGAPRDLGRGLATRAIEAVLNEDLEPGGDRS